VESRGKMYGTESGRSIAITSSEVTSMRNIHPAGYAVRWFRDCWHWSWRR